MEVPSFSSFANIGWGVRVPATTSSPWAFIKNSPNIFLSPSAGDLVNTTPVAELFPLLPKTIDWILTAVPKISCSLILLIFL